MQSENRYQQDYPEEWQMVQSLLSQWRQRRRWNKGSNVYCDSEWELRVSIVEADGTIVSGVSEATHLRILRLLTQRTEELRGATQGKKMTMVQSETRDYCYQVPNGRIKSTHGTRFLMQHRKPNELLSVRTTVTADLIKRKFFMYHHHKSVQFVHDIVGQVTDRNPYPLLQAQTPIKYRARIQLAHEIPIDVNDLPELVQPTFMRIKQRKSFHFSSPSNNEFAGDWRYDLTMVASGKCKAEAERNLQLGNVRYEVELEYLPKNEKDKTLEERLAEENESLYEKRIEYITLSMLLKLKDLLCTDQDQFLYDQ